MHSFVPLDKMWERFHIDKEDSDVAAFFAALYLGEMLTKTVVLGMLAAMQEDREGNRYSQLHKLVRADGLGVWVEVLDSVLQGPASTNLINAASTEQKQLIQKVGSENWQYVATEKLWNTISELGYKPEPLPSKLQLRMWFALFSYLRNKTRGHGAPKAEQCSRVLTDVAESIDLVQSNLNLFHRPWAHLHRNFSLKYRVSGICGDRSCFDFLKTEKHHALSDGIYIQFDTPRRVDLLETDSDIQDFFYPNGQFGNSKYETISYITNDKHLADGLPFEKVTAPLPESETHGRTSLEIIGNVFTNIPDVSRSYVRRDKLESALAEQLVLDRHPLITLTGPGGIGKTSVALRVLHTLCGQRTPRYETIVWLSARDIDLLMEGAKQVQPTGLTLKDFASHCVQLFGPTERGEKDFKAISYLSNLLSSTTLGATLFIFDNFETVSNPADLYNWIDAQVRLPNKVLITTRMREFTGDYTVQVTGMTYEESQSLIEAAANELAISQMMTKAYADEVFEEADGHPYVMRILLGEAAKEKRLVKPERIIASQDDVLTALFERSYMKLSPASQRIFLLLCSWRSVVPELALETVILHCIKEKIDIVAALEELKQMSLIEEIVSEADKEIFFFVPLSAMIFGRRKLNASQWKTAIDHDTRILQSFGVTRKDEVRSGIFPRIHRLIRTIAERVASGEETLEDNRPLLEFVASRVPIAWPIIAELFEEQGTTDWIQQSERCLRRYLEVERDPVRRKHAWSQLAYYCRILKDSNGEVHALAEICDFPMTETEEISNAANRVGALSKDFKSWGMSGEERKILIGRIVNSMEKRIASLDATDVSRLAWLHVFQGDKERALTIVDRALQAEPNNQFCQQLRGILE